MANYILKTGERITVDDDLLPTLEGMSWRRTRGETIQRGYREGGKVVTETLATFIMGEKAPRGFAWWHVDGNWRNFRRENLQLRERGSWLYDDAAALQQWREKGGKASRDSGVSTRRDRREIGDSGYRGVQKSGNKYRAMASIGGKQTYLGLHATAEDAAKAYDAALIEHGGAAINFPEPAF